jgi:glycosyltransferase involved in cell wall biosynthesis
MKIAMIGQKGVILTAKSGRIDKHVAEISTHLIDRGHWVTAYTRPRYATGTPAEYHGIHLQYVPRVFLLMHALFQNYDIIHLHGVWAATFAWIPRLFLRKTKVIATLHVPDELRSSWFIGRALFWLKCALAVYAPHYCLVANHEMQVYARKWYRRELVFIPQGTVVREVEEIDELAAFGLQPNEYLIHVGSLLPGKGLRELIDAFKELQTQKQLVFVGVPHFSDTHYARLRKRAGDDHRIHFFPSQSDEVIEQLLTHAYLSIQPSGQEGLPAMAFEAMGHGTAPLVSDSESHRKALHGTGFTFRPSKDLKNRLEDLLRREDHVREVGEEGRAIMETEFSWAGVTDKIESVYQTARH